MTHTPKELAAEFEYQRQERLGMMCGDRPPTAEQERIATATAQEAVERLKAQEK